MSLINKVLQDLDQRSAMSAPDSSPPQQVRVVPPPKAGREWFWRIVAGLMVLALAWVAWITYQLQPRPVATELAFRAAEEAKQRRPAPPKPEADRSAKPAPSVPAPAVPSEVFKLALSIDTPIAERAEEARKPQKAAAAPQGPAAPAAPAAKTKPAAPLAPASSMDSKLEKRDQARSTSDRADADYRRGVNFINQGRVSEGEIALGSAVAADPAHEAARQTLVALYLEQRRIPEATRQLQEALAINPRQLHFAVVLARIHAERGDHASALDVLNRVKSTAGGDAEFNALLGAVLQRLSRHPEAAEAYRAAVNAVPHSGISWVGLGISLEAMARRPEAAEAFKRGVATGTLTAEVKTFAEQRARALY
jgi:MSHA biogenesis protein MshN